METVNKMKSQPTEWETVSASGTTETESTSKIYKQLIQLNAKNQKTLTETTAEELNMHVSQEEVQMATGTGKGALHHQPPGQSRSEPQRGAASHPSRRPPWKRTQPPRRLGRGEESLGALLAGA